MLTALASRRQRIRWLAADLAGVRRVAVLLVDGFGTSNFRWQRRRAPPWPTSPRAGSAGCDRSPAGSLDDAHQPGHRRPGAAGAPRVIGFNVNVPGTSRVLTTSNGSTTQIRDSGNR